MRPVLHGDVSAAARALLAVPAGARRGLCAMLLAEAEVADRHRRTTGRLHRLWGDGTLMAAARRRTLAPERRFDDPDYCSCFELVLRALMDRQVSQRRS